MTDSTKEICSPIFSQKGAVRVRRAWISSTRRSMRSRRTLSTDVAVCPTADRASPGESGYDAEEDGDGANIPMRPLVVAPARRSLQWHQEELLAFLGQILRLRAPADARAETWQSERRVHQAKACLRRTTLATLHKIRHAQSR